MAEFDVIEFPKDVFSRLRDSHFTKQHTFYPTDDNDITRMGLRDLEILYKDIKTDRENIHSYYSRLDEYEEMNKALPEFDAIYNIYTDEITIENAFNNRILWTHATKEELIEESDSLIDMLKLPLYLPMITYNLVSTGNAFAELDIKEEGVAGITIHDVRSIKRIEAPDKTLLGFALVPDVRVNISYKHFLKALKFKKDYLKKHSSLHKGVIKKKVGYYPFFDFEMIHWRLQKHNSLETYGYSVMDAMRDHWRSNVMARASLILARVTQSSSRRRINVEVGKTTNVKEIRKKMLEFGQLFKRKKIFNGGEIKTVFDPFSEMEELVIPMQDGVPMFDIEEIPGKDVTAKTEDVQYLDKKMENVSLVPSSVLNGENEGRSTIAQESMRFAKRIFNIQMEITRGTDKIVRIHLLANKHSIQELHDAKLSTKMTYTSDTAKLVQLETLNQMVDYFKNLEEVFPNKERYYMAFGLTPEKYKEMYKNLNEEKIEKGVGEAKVEVEVAKYQNKNMPKDEQGY